MSGRSSFIKAMVKDNYPYAIESYDAVVKVRDQLFDIQDSTASYEQFTSAIGPGKLTKVAEGAAIPLQSAAEGFTVICANNKFPTGLPLTNEAIDDNQKIGNFLKDWAKGLGESTALTIEGDHADIFNKGGYTSGDSGAFGNSIAGVITPSYGNYIYDGKPFFALSGNEHTAKNGSTYLNSKASLSLGGTALEQLVRLISVTNAYDEKGNEVSIRPDTLLLQENSTNYFIAKRLLESTGDADAPHAGITNIWKSSLRLVGWRFLTSSNAIYVGCAKKGIKSLNRMPLTIDYDEDKNKQIQIVYGTTRFGKCVTNFRYWVAANLPTS